MGFVEGSLRSALVLVMTVICQGFPWGEPPVTRYHLSLSEVTAAWEMTFRVVTQSLADTASAWCTVNRIRCRVIAVKVAP